MRIKFVKSEKLDLLSGAGLNLVGQILERHTTLRKDLNRQFLKQPHGLGTGDVVTAYLLSLCTGKSDYEAVSRLDEHVLGPESVGLKAFPSPPPSIARRPRSHSLRSWRWSLPCGSGSTRARICICPTSRRPQWTCF